MQIASFLSAQVSSQSTTSLLTYCFGGAYNSSGPYSSSIKSLLSVLILSAPSSPALYYSSSSSTSAVVGLAQCRPDASPQLCSECLSLASAALSPGGLCGLNKSAVVRYDNCLLRYSDESFLGSPMLNPLEGRFNVETAPSRDEFAARARRLVQQVSAAAADARSRYSADESRGGDDLYGMAWCTRDLTHGDCLQCLYWAMSELIVTKVGAQVQTPSCSLRFETYVFFSLPGDSADRDNTTTTGGTSQWRHKTKTSIIGGATGAAAFLFLSAIFILLVRRARKKAALLTKRRQEEDLSSAATLMLDLATIRSATNNFSEANKLGEGGFGPVYKGVLVGGQEIAVKRLSKSSGQGITEMKNEVVFVAKLQHKNLVRLVGCCLEEDEKLLVYEYLPNTSLDKLLFDPDGQMQLDWPTRYKIIEGICRGLLYLHEDSRFRIIHRDLKASNILLDGDMNPKISDFGLAKLSGINEPEGNTTRIAGTYGYMSPEYAFCGLFSTKSDVFSYGVIVLEIITGRSSSCFLSARNNLDFLSYVSLQYYADSFFSFFAGLLKSSALRLKVWQYWNQGMALQLVDRRLGIEYPQEEALRCIQIGLLCVQEDPAERPSMNSLAVMLSRHSTLLPDPSMPEFLQRLQVIVAHSSEIDMPRSDYSDRRGNLSTSDCLSSSSSSFIQFFPASPQN